VSIDLRIAGALLDGAPADIDVADGRVAAIRRAGEGPAGGESPGGPRTADASVEGPAGGAAATPSGTPARVIDVAGCAAFPGFRNAHTHAAMTLLRGYGDDMPLDAWLRTRIWPAEALLTEEDVYHGTRLALLEMVRSGTTYLNDMYWHRPGARRAVRELGLRAHLGSPFVDFGDAARGRASRDLVAAEAEAVADDGPLVELSVAPHAIYTVSPENLAWIADFAGERGLMVHIHLSETEGEVRDCVAAHGVRPAFLLERAGLLGPRLVCAHAVHLDDAERALLAAAGATVVTNPAANMKLAVGGPFDYAAARAAGLRVALGTDGPASNNSVDMVEAMKTASLLQKQATGDPAALPATEAVAIATAGPLPGMLAEPGAIRVGDPADLALVRMDAPETAPAHDAVSALVYAASGAQVDTTVCAGRVLMHRRVVEVADEEAVVAEATARARALVERAGAPRSRASWAAACALLAGAALAAASCAEPGRDRNASPREGVRIVLVTHGQAADPYWSIVANGAADAAADLGVDVQYQAPTTFDMVAMSDLIDGAVAGRPAGLAVSIPDAAALRPAIERALAAGIPVVSINSGADASRRLGLLAHVGQPEYEAGRAAGARLADLGHLAVLCVHHEVGNAALDERCAGAADALVEAGGDATVVPVDLGDPDDTEQRIRGALARGGYDAVLTLGPTAAGPALAAVAGTGVEFATFDLTAEVAGAVADGRALFAVDQQPYLQGYLPVVMLVKHAETLTMPGGGGVVATGPRFVTAEDAARVRELARRGVR